MWSRWLQSYPELALLDLDVGQTGTQDRSQRGISSLAMALMPRDERILWRILNDLAEGAESRASTLAINESQRGTLLHDIDLLAGAFLLRKGKCAEALVPLRECYLADSQPGLAIRRMYPGLRLQLRISPVLLMPLYPNPYGVSLMYAVALWHSGEPNAALEVLKEMEDQWGFYDEVRLVAGQIMIELGDTASAIRLLTVQEVIERDALELARSMYLAYAHYVEEEYRSAARPLIASLTMVRDVNPHLFARSHLLMADIYERNGFPLEALRFSGMVEPGDVPGDVAAVMLAREERWVTELAYLKDDEIERLAHADTYQMYMPDKQGPTRKFSPLATTRDPLKDLKPQTMSWRTRREEEREIESYQAARARGESVRLPDPTVLSPQGKEYRSRIRAAEQWWPARRQALAQAPARERLARQDPLEVGHLAFDFAGTREAPGHSLEAENRSRFVGIFAGAMVGIAILLLILRSCVYFWQ